MAPVPLKARLKGHGHSSDFLNGRCPDWVRCTHYMQQEPRQDGSKIESAQQVEHH